MKDKSSNLKEKLKQALSSTARVISDDFKVKKNIDKNDKSIKTDFLNIENLNSKYDFTKARAESDSKALKIKFSNDKIFKKISQKTYLVNLFIQLLKKLDMSL